MTRFILVPLLFSLVLGGSALSFPDDQDDLLENIGKFNPNFFAELQDVELLGDRAYVFGVGGLAVIDITDPTIPTQLGRYEPPGHPYNRFYRGAVEGDLALGGGREDLLSVMDLSGGGNPVLAAVHGTPGQTFEGVTLRDGIGYACRHGDGLEIIDFTQKTNPVTLGEVLSLTNAWDVALQGHLAYVADGIGGLAVVNVAHPAAPVHLLSLPTSGSANDVVADWSKLRNYSTGPSLKGDIQVSVEGIEFGTVPVGSYRDTTFTIGNTGGADISVFDIQAFSDSYTITTATSFILPAGQSREVGLRFDHLNAGFAGTFLRIDSDDKDEGSITFPLSADDNPNSLNIGEPAPGFTLTDMDGVTHSLVDGLGRVVVMAYFANW